MSNRSIYAFVCLLAFALVSNALAAGKGVSRTVLYNGKVFTSNPANLWAEGVVIQGNKVLHVGSNDFVQNFINPHTTVIDLDGRTVIPGINNAHTHAPLPIEGTVLDTGRVFFGPGPSTQEMLDLIRAAAESTPAGTWIQGTVGFIVFEEPRLTRFLIDQVAPDHPVLLIKFAGHGTIFNTKAMELMGVSETEPDPPGGFFLRVEGTNVQNGIAREYAEWTIVRRKVRELIPLEDAAKSYRCWANDQLTFGVTSVQDMTNSLDALTTKNILEVADIPLRWRAICFQGTPDEACIDQNAGPVSLPDSLVTFYGRKWILDGSPIERGAYMREAYSDDPGNRGIFNFSQSMFEQIIAQGLVGNPGDQQMLLHAVGDQTIYDIIEEMMVQAPTETWAQRRVRMEHGDFLTPELFPDFMDMNMVYVQNGTHLVLDALSELRFGEERAAHQFPLRSLLDHGINLALGTDAVGGTDNPFVDLMFLAIHPSNPEEAISIEEAVIAYTLGSAYAEFQEDKKGSLEHNKLADLAVLSQDIFSAEFTSLPGTRSVLTIVDGKIAYDAGVLQITPASK